jgi:FkbM family methyltransferase
MKFYSQQQEDKILYEKYLNFRNGIFIELGAMDGIIYSNSLFFEKELEWTGILIEPTEQFEQLMINRPNCHNFNYAISSTEGEVAFLGSGPLGGMTETMSDWHRKGWKLDNNPPYIVKSIPISKIVEQSNIDRVDLFSIDVEGGESEVLKTFDWKIPVYLVLIEGDYTATEEEKKSWISNPNSNGLTVDESYVERINQCTEILKSNGFEFIEKIGCNDVWINKNNKRTW